jgi:hypothetical protein
MEGEGEGEVEGFGRRVELTLCDRVKAKAGGYAGSGYVGL